MLLIIQTRSMVVFLFILFIVTMSPLCAEVVLEDKVLAHNIEIELYVKEHKLKAVDRMVVRCKDAEKVSFLINGAFQIQSVGASNRKLDFKAAPKGDWQRLEIEIPKDLMQSDGVVLDIAYEGCLFDRPASLELEDVGATTGIIDEAGVYLSPACAWYPDIPGSLAAFTVTVITLKDMRR